MGAGQIGGIATLLNIDFSNSAGFEGKQADLSDGHFIVYFLSHAMVFCVGAIIEAHVVLTAASCVFGERHRFEVTGGTHTFLENIGVSRTAHHMCLHRGYNHSRRWESCFTDNMALLLLGEQFDLDRRVPAAQHPIRRLRYGVPPPKDINKRDDCKFYGWGSRRNGFLLPLLIDLREVKVRVMSRQDCEPMWNFGDKYLCTRTPACKDDLGTVMVCEGFLAGLMTSRLVDRPCGIGFLDMDQYLKFLTCGVDEAREVLAHEEFSGAIDDRIKPTRPDIKTLPTQPHYDHVWDVGEVYIERGKGKKKG